MADVVITLSLARKSGILAAAVSAISRAGLTFGTHRFVEADDGHQLCLRAESEGEFGDPRAVIDELSGIRGVEAILDVVVDSHSLLNSEPESEPESSSSLEQASGPEPEPEPETKSEPEFQAEREPELAAAESGKAVDSPPAEEGQETTEPNGPTRLSKVRRRRRRR